MTSTATATAILCGGEAARRALRTASLHPGDSDEAGNCRHIVLATYQDYDAFLQRLPAYLTDITRSLEGQLAHADATQANIKHERRRLSNLANGLLCWSRGLTVWR